MKQYLISEEELKELLKSTVRVAVNETDPIIDDTIFAFKLSKTPIEPSKDNKQNNIKIIAKECGKEFIHHLVRDKVDVKNRLEGFATNLLQKLSLLDRENVGKIIDKNTFLAGNLDYENFINAILSLIPEQATPEKIREILEKHFCIEVGGINPEPMDKAIKELSQLSKPKIDNWKYRRIVCCKNCGQDSDLEFHYSKNISETECPLCGCKTLQLSKPEGEVIGEGTVMQETDLTVQNRVWGYSLYKDETMIDLFDLFKKYRSEEIIIIHKCKESK